MTPEVNKFYRHKKGALYQVKAIALHSETLEPLVIYQDAENPSKVWARPQEMFVDGRFTEEGDRQ